jgi:hypothetical protein
VATRIALRRGALTVFDAATRAYRRLPDDESLSILEAACKAHRMAHELPNRADYAERESVVRMAVWSVSALNVLLRKRGQPEIVVW